jgi:hypothetical protein
MFGMFAFAAGLTGLGLRLAFVLGLPLWLGMALGL